MCDNPQPFWQSRNVRDESVLFMEEADGAYRAHLMRTPDDTGLILRDRYGAVYAQGVDYAVEGNCLVWLPESRIPVLTKEAYAPSVPPQSMAHYAPFGKEGGLLLYMEDAFLVEKQVYAFYRIAQGQPGFTGHTPPPRCLARTKARLEAGRTLRIALLGDSLGEGCNCSAMLGIHPFAQPWYTQFAQGLIARYRTRVEIPLGWNLSKGGELSAYGVKQAASVAALQPDLAILEFGTNDGTFHVSPDQYAENMKIIIDVITTANPACECILCAPLLVNPDAVQCGNQMEYLAPLYALEAAHANAAVADFTTLHGAMLLQGKRYSEISANNINHPNDFLIRALADCLLALFSD